LWKEINLSVITIHLTILNLLKIKHVLEYRNQEDKWRIYELNDVENDL